MVPAETTSMKPCKLCIVCLIYFSQQARGDETRCTMMKRNCFILSDNIFKGRESNPT